MELWPGLKDGLIDSEAKIELLFLYKIFYLRIVALLRRMPRQDWNYER